MRGIITALKLNTEERQLLLNAAMYIYVKPAAPQPVQQEPEEITDHVSPGDLAKIEPARDPVPATEEEFLNKYRQAV